MSDRHRFKLVHEHTETEWGYHEFVDLGPPPTKPAWLSDMYGAEPYEVRLDAIGRRHDYGYYRWRLLVCNDDACKGRARYRRDIVEQLANEWDERR